MISCHISIEKVMHSIIDSQMSLYMHAYYDARD